MLITVCYQATIPPQTQTINYKPHVIILFVNIIIIFSYQRFEFGKQLPLCGITNEKTLYHHQHYLM